MICPRCGSRDVVDNRLPDEKIIEAECLNCQHEWKQKYEPFLKEDE